MVKGTLCFKHSRSRCTQHWNDPIFDETRLQPSLVNSFFNKNTHNRHPVVMDWDHSGGGRWLNCHILKLPANEACEWGWGRVLFDFMFKFGPEISVAISKTCPAETSATVISVVECIMRVQASIYVLPLSPLCVVQCHVFSLLCIVQSHVFMMTFSNGNSFRVTGPLCGEFTGPGEFPTQRPVTQSFDVFFNLRLNKRLSKQPWGWGF